ncbi:hypothetical protein C8Q79DRAFT_510542 [Trametes meyenii]|nr:hypothetical protein C8Q79DRAFT_510542 [Trametes meyenii]
MRCGMRRVDASWDQHHHHLPEGKHAGGSKQAASEHVDDGGVRRFWPGLDMDTGSHVLRATTACFDAHVWRFGDRRGSGHEIAWDDPGTLVLSRTRAGLRPTVADRPISTTTGG